MTDRIQASALVQLQLGDAHRACLCATSNLRSIVGNAVDSTLIAEARRLEATVIEAADAIADLLSRARLQPRTATEVP